MKKSPRYALLLSVVFLTVICLLGAFLILRGRNRVLPTGDLPNREIVFVQGDNTLGFINPDGSGYVTRTLELEREVFGGLYTFAPRIVPPITWSSDGHLAGRYAVTISDEASPFVVSSTGNITRCSSQTPQGEGRIWFEDGKLVGIQSAEMGERVVQLDSSRCQIVGDLYLPQQGIWPPVRLRDVSISRNGWLAILRWTTDYETVIVDASGIEKFRLPPAAGATWSPDGDFLAYVVQSGNQDNGLYVIDKNNTQKKRLVADNRIGTPSWSPDGQWLVYDRSDNGQPAIYKLQIDTGKETLLIHGGASPAWRTTTNPEKQP
jgi:WD40 repeat protein